MVLEKSFVQIARKILIGWLLVLLVGYAESSTLFLHSHFINGEWITHSHPYSDTPDSGKHTHTSSQLITIASLSTWLMLAILPGYSFAVFPSEYVAKTGFVNRYYTARRYSHLFLRGPPVPLHSFLRIQQTAT